MEGMFCRRLKPEIKFVLPSLYKAENTLCCHQQSLKRADIIVAKHCSILYTDQATNIFISMPLNLCFFANSMPLNLTKQFIIKYTYKNHCT